MDATSVGIKSSPFEVLWLFYAASWNFVYISLFYASASKIGPLKLKACYQWPDVFTGGKQS